MKKFVRNILAFVLVVTIGQLIVFHHYNILFLQSAQAGTTKAKAKQSNKVASAKTVQSSKAQREARKRKNEVAALKSYGYQDVLVSPEKDYIAYLDNQNVLRIEDVKTQKVISAAKNPYNVDYLSWIENPRASSAYVLVGEKIGPGNLELKTVNISDGSQQIIFHVSQLFSTAQVKQVVFSFLTNQIYILVNTHHTSAIYHIGTMKHIHDVPIGGRFIEKIAMSQTTHRLYFEDHLNGQYNVLYFNDSYVPHRVQLNAALITVIKNTVYYGKLNQNGLVTSVYKQGANRVSTLVQSLNTPTAASNIHVTQSGTIQIAAQTTTTTSGSVALVNNTSHQG